MAKNGHHSFIPGLLMCMLAVPAFAVEVYQWTDENGVVHFSQWSPGEEVEDVETVSVEGGGQQENGIGISAEDDPEGYQAHEEAMQELWAEIEKRREASHRQSRPEPTTEIIYLGREPEYAVPYFPPRFRPHPRPPRPGPRPRPPMEPEEPDMPVVRPVPYKRP